MVLLAQSNRGVDISVACRLRWVCVWWSTVQYDLNLCCAPFSHTHQGLLSCLAMYTGKATWNLSRIFYQLWTGSASINNYYDSPWSPSLQSWYGLLERYCWAISGLPCNLLLVNWQSICRLCTTENVSYISLFTKRGEGKTESDSNVRKAWTLFG